MQGGAIKVFKELYDEAISIIHVTQGVYIEKDNTKAYLYDYVKNITNYII